MGKSAAARRLGVQVTVGGAVAQRVEQGERNADDNERQGEEREEEEGGPGCAGAVDIRRRHEGRDGAAAWVGDGYDGVHCFAPDGKIIGKIHLPEGVSNLCFGGGHKKNRLYITGSQSLYAVYLETKGAQHP